MYYKQDNSTCELYSDEYFVDIIERRIKFEINIKYLVHNNRTPTKDEYQSTFNDWIKKLNFQITKFDLGIYD